MDSRSLLPEHKIILLDLFLPRDEHKKYSGQFAKWLTVISMPPSSSLIPGLDVYENNEEEINALFQKFVASAISNVKTFNITKKDRFHFPSKISIQMKPNDLLNDTQIENFASQWFTLRGKIKLNDNYGDEKKKMISDWMASNSYLSNSFPVSFLDLFQNPKKYWNISIQDKKNGIRPSKKEKNVFCYKIVHGSLLKDYVDIMKKELEDGKIETCQDLINHPYTSFMKEVSALNAGRILYTLFKNEKRTKNGEEEDEREQHFEREYVKYYPLLRNLTLNLNF